MSYRSALLFVLLFFLAGYACAESPGLAVEEAQEKDPFAFTWQRTREAVSARNLLAVQEEIAALENLKLLLGVRSLESYSAELIEDATDELRAGNLDEASFYVRKAFQLSPQSPYVVLSAFSIAPATGVASRAELFGKLLSQVISSPLSLFSAAHLFLYPLLWAVTFGIILSILLLLITQCDEVLRAVALRMPLQSRGFLAPLFIALCVFVPFFFGPLAVLSVTVLMVYLFLPRFRWTAFVGSVVVALWGFVLPLQENVTVWLGDSGVQALLRVYEGGHQEGDLERLGDLVSRRPSDGVAIYTYGTLLRRFGKYHEAEKAFLLAEKNLPSPAWTKAQLGMLAFLRSDTQQALEYYEQAESEGLDTAAFYFNFSKIAFDLLDTTRSRELADKARGRDRAFVRELQEREASVGMKDASATAELPLPFDLLYQSALTPVPGVSLLYEKKAASLFQGVSPQALGILGVVLCIVFFFVSAERQARRFQLYYTEYALPASLVVILKLIPGGAWVWAKRPLWAVLILSLVFIALLPLLHWPSEVSQVFELFSFSKRVYLIPFGIFLLGLYYLSFFLSREEDEQ